MTVLNFRCPVAEEGHRANCKWRSTVELVFGNILWTECDIKCRVRVVNPNTRHHLNIVVGTNGEGGGGCCPQVQASIEGADMLEREVWFDST